MNAIVRIGPTQSSGRESGWYDDENSRLPGIDRGAEAEFYITKFRTLYKVQRPLSWTLFAQSSRQSSKHHAQSSEQSSSMRIWLVSGCPRALEVSIPIPNDLRMIKMLSPPWSTHPAQYTTVLGFETSQASNPWLRVLDSTSWPCWTEISRRLPFKEY